MFVESEITCTVLIPFGLNRERFVWFLSTTLYFISFDDFEVLQRLEPVFINLTDIKGDITD